MTVELALPGEEMEIERKIRIWHEVRELVQEMYDRCYFEATDETAYHEIESRIYNFVLKEIFR